MVATLLASGVIGPQGAIEPLDSVDVLVCGGGVAGLAAAIAAGRNGARTLLVESQGFLGGALTAAGMTQWNAGAPRMSGLADEIKDRLVARGGAIDGSVIPINSEAFKDLAFELCDEAGVEVLLFTQVTDVVLEGSRAVGVTIATKAGPRAILAKVVIDATGDADVVEASGAPTVRGRESDGRMRPISLLFRVGGIDIQRVAAYALAQPDQFLVDKDRNVVDMDRKLLRLVGYFDAVKRAQAERRLDPDVHYLRLESVDVDRGVAMINNTRVYDVDGANPSDMTKAMRTARAQMAELLEFLRSDVEGFENAYLLDSAPTLGVRETRRAVGQYVLTESDIESDRSFPNSVLRTYGRHIVGHDVHSPDAGEGASTDEFYRTRTLPVIGYNIPYRALVPKSVDGLLVAGRCISVTQEADRMTRNQPQCILTGQAAGTAAALSAKEDVGLRQINMETLQAMLAEQNVALPSNR